jgi:hypothetical protein
MGEGGASVTLVLYSIQNPFREASLNLLAAAAQGSSYCHVELALGETGGANCEMTNVLRVRTSF